MKATTNGIHRNIYFNKTHLFARVQVAYYISYDKVTFSNF